MTTLDAIWPQFPDSNCRGLCRDVCANVPTSLGERERIWQATGVVFPDPFAEGALTGDCPLLTPDGRCGGYEVRPSICRAWGSVESLPCPHGCRPTLGLIPDSVARGLLEQSKEAS